MSQQTSIYNFYKSVNPKYQLTKKPESITTKFSENTTPKNKVRGSRKIKREPSLTATSLKSPRKSFDKSTNRPIVNFDNVINGNDESSFIRNEICTPKKSPDNSFKNKLPVTPNSDNKNRKRSSSESGVSRNSSLKKKIQTSGTRSVMKHLKHRSPRKLFYNELIDTGNVSDMVENLNLSRVGVLPKNNFNLEKYYSEIDYEPEVIDFDADVIISMYDINRVNIPREKHAEHLFFIITQVFSNPSNCGYFDNEELDLIFGILSLSEKAQMLFARLIKRKYCWKSSSSIEYPEIDSNLRPYFDELEKHGLITTDMDNENLETMLNTLSADKVRNICRESKIPRQSNKHLAIKKILQTSSIKSIFPGAETPAKVLRKRISAALDHCVSLPKAVISLIDRIMTLFIPTEDVTSQLSEIFFKLTLIKEGTLRYPEAPVQYSPVFQNREHLIRYVEKRNNWKRALEIPRGAKENWEILKEIARDAHSRLMLLLRENQSSQQHTAIPRHVQKFREEYVCIKIITACLEVFKKESSTIEEAVEMLKNLIHQSRYLQGRKGEWYEELALIEMWHKKNLAAAALTTIEGLSLPNITETGKHVLTKRAFALAKRKSGLDKDLKIRLKNFLDKETLRNTPTVSINANVVQGNQVGHKSIWSLDMEAGEKGYMSVEHRAKYYYGNNGYPEGWHCEGSLPVTIFTLLFWNELYCIPVRAAYLSAYQTAPLDLYTSEFYNNRKEHVEQRMELLQALNTDELGSLIEGFLETRQHYESLMPTKLAVTSTQLRDIVQCMGPSIAIGICKRLALNFGGCKAGFPDLFVWNSNTLKCKFVEVKGPGDTLSVKQTLWLRYLEDLGAATELCEVKATTKK